MHPIDRLIRYTVPTLFFALGMFGLAWAAKFTMLAAYDGLVSWLGQ